MSYTPPAGTAAAVSWQGEAVYTPPAGGAAATSFEDTTATPEAVITAPALLPLPAVLAEVSFPRAVITAPALLPLPAVVVEQDPQAVIVAPALLPLPAGFAWLGQPADPAPDVGQTTLKWRARVTLGGVDRSDQLVGPISVEGAENEAAIASFAFDPEGAVDVIALSGQAVVIEFERTAGPAYLRRMFTGVVEEAEFDMQTGVVSCLCHDQFQEIMAGQTRAWIDAAVGGRWSEAVSGTPADNFAYLQARLESVPKSMALDPYGVPTVLPWRGGDIAKAATLTPDDWLDGTPRLTMPSRDSLRTRVVVRMQYRYQRLRARYITAEWSQPIGWFIWRETSGERHSLQWLSVAMVKSACEGLSGWEIIGTMDITSPAPGVYLNEGWDDGGIVITPDEAPNLALGFTTYLGTRWQQTVTEDYTVTVVNDSLETALGKEISDEIGANLVAEFDQAAWETDASVGPGPVLVVSEPSTTPPPIGDTIEVWQPEGFDEAARDEIMRTLLDQAWVRLATATRTGRISLDVSIRPDLWLDWWLTIEATKVRAAGKVAAYKHVLDPDAGEATTSLEVALALPGNVHQALPTWSLPATPADTSPAGTYTCTIGEYIGGLETSVPFDEATMVGFSTNLADLLTDAAKASREWYPLQLSIQAPDLEETARDPLTLTTSATINVAVPTDLLEFI